MDDTEGWEWPLLVLILECFPATVAGERQAVNWWAAIVRAEQKRREAEES